ncbi:hypothetical protein SDC9_112223 [bioreactor metagenome]|uniref:Uncharacterized protein n=1 Tax=bioreactor metagenome TaxID=1076179 RepID=A0A645BJQ3_9ZZZZ
MGPQSFGEAPRKVRTDTSPLSVGKLSTDRRAVAGIQHCSGQDGYSCRQLVYWFRARRAGPVFGAVGCSYGAESRISMQCSFRCSDRSGSCLRTRWYFPCFKHCSRFRACHRTDASKKRNVRSRISWRNGRDEHYLAYVHPDL